MSEGSSSGWACTCGFGCTVADHASWQYLGRCHACWNVCGHAWSPLTARTALLLSAAASRCATGDAFSTSTRPPRAGVSSACGRLAMQLESGEFDVDPEDEVACRAVDTILSEAALLLASGWSAPSTVAPHPWDYDLQQVRSDVVEIADGPLELVVRETVWSP